MLSIMMNKQWHVPAAVWFGKVHSNVLSVSKLSWPPPSRRWVREGQACFQASSRLACRFCKAKVMLLGHAPVSAQHGMFQTWRLPLLRHSLLAAILKSKDMFPPDPEGELNTTGPRLTFCLMHGLGLVSEAPCGSYS